MDGAKNGNQREEIVRVAYGLFMERGYDNVTLREIAVECGIKPPLLQYYFPKRADLVVAVFYDLIARTTAFVSSEVAKLGALPEDDSDLACYDAFYHLFYRVLHADGDRLLKLYTVVLYDAELLKGGTDIFWRRPEDYNVPRRTYKSKLGAYAVNGILSQLVLIYLSDPLSGDLDSMVGFALDMYYATLGVDGERLERVLEASSEVLAGRAAREFAERESAR